MKTLESRRRRRKRTSMKNGQAVAVTVWVGGGGAGIDIFDMKGEAGNGGWKAVSLRPQMPACLPCSSVSCLTSLPRHSCLEMEKTGQAGGEALAPAYLLSHCSITLPLLITQHHQASAHLLHARTHKLHSLSGKVTCGVTGRTSLPPAFLG